MRERKRTISSARLILLVRGDSEQARRRHSRSAPESGNACVVPPYDRDPAWASKRVCSTCCTDAGIAAALRSQWRPLIWCMRDGRAVYPTAYAHRADALRDLGLSEVELKPDPPS